jgi:hypothetical protein
MHEMPVPMVAVLWLERHCAHLENSSPPFAILGKMLSCNGAKQAVRRH